MNEKADLHAKAITAAICEAIVAHEAVWHRSAPLSAWDAPRKKLETAIAMALRSAGAVHIDYD